ncbi:MULTISPECIES: hypothetical protein [Bacillaceae]|uniref:SCP2 domain-containing protein n=1 Tax=Evansella alkalicola TaxID=745819 RepID=A0ABS6JUC8_9BACI|nr:MULTISPECIES: hypothetical protein [Bacillaceae]MBU9722177.1 hypothetical protein [Bacillus alkalicola]
MNLNQIVANAVDRLRKARHLEGLLEKANFNICINSGDHGTWMLHFRESEVILKNLIDDEESYDIRIEGESKQLSELLQGDDFLLAMKNRGDISVTGSLKDLLLLESLLYLSKGSVIG